MRRHEWSLAWDCASTSMMPLSVSTGYELRNAQVLDDVARRYIGPLVRVTDAGVNTTGDAGTRPRQYLVSSPSKYLWENCTAKKLCNATCECWRPLEHDQKLLKCQQMQSDVYKMQENAWRPELRPGLRWGSLQRSPRPLAGWEEVAAPPQELHLALGLSSLAP